MTTGYLKAFRDSSKYFRITRRAGPDYLNTSWEGQLVARWNWREPKVLRASGMRAVRQLNNCSGQYSGLVETAERADCEPAGHCSQEAGGGEA